MFAYCYNNPIVFVDSEGSRPIVGTNASTETKEEREQSFAYMRSVQNITSASKTNTSLYSDFNADFLESYIESVTLEDFKLFINETVSVLGDSASFKLYP